jgi:hypothetical protein
MSSEIWAIFQLTSYLYRNGIEVYCCGENIDRIVFNPRAGKAYHAFVTGHALKNGLLELAAGAAHGVQEGARYRIYSNNVITRENKIPEENKITTDKNEGVYLVAKSVEDFTTLFHSSTAIFPSVFYAVETYCPSEQVNIFIPDPTALPDKIATLLGSNSEQWKQVETAEQANITLKTSEGKVSVLWNGVTNKGELRKTVFDDKTSISAEDLDEAILARIFTYIARFTHHVSREPPPKNRSISEKLRVELQELDLFALDEDGQNIPIDGLVVKMEVDECVGPFSLTLYNDNDFDLWPFVFICYPIVFEIGAFLYTIYL